jgi:hypothetical protein
MRGTICLLAVLALLATVACRSTKKIQTAISKKDTVKVVVLETEDARADSLRFIREMFSKIHQNRIEFRTFSAKIKVNFQISDGRNYDFNAYVHVRKDSAIWILINAALGFEAFRVLITPDSVKVIDRLEKIVQLRSVSYLQEVAKIPIDFGTLQDLLVGNPIYLDSNVIFYRKETGGISLMSVGTSFKNYMTLNRDDYTLLHSKLDDVDLMRARTCELTYAGYDQRDRIHFSTYRQVSFAEKSKVDIQMNFKQYNFNEPLSFPFSLPKNYLRK